MEHQGRIDLKCAVLLPNPFQPYKTSRVFPWEAMGNKQNFMSLIKHKRVICMCIKNFLTSSYVPTTH